MSVPIKLVRADNRPVITLTIVDESTGSPIDLSGATEVVKFRLRGGASVLSTLPCTHVTDGSDGKTKFQFPGTSLDVAAGLYEGEIDITFTGGDKQAVYEALKFQVRERF